MEDKMYRLKKIGEIYLSFWIVPLILTLTSLLLKKNFSTIDDNSMITKDFWVIFSRNITVYFFIGLLGLLNKYLPYVLYYYNSLVFSLFFSISIETIGITNSLLRIVPHGVFEILAFATATFVGYNIKISKIKKETLILLVSGAFLILLAAIVESKITPLVIQ